MKDTFTSPQVVAALITGTVMIFVAMLPTLTSNNASPAPVQESTLTTVPTEENPTVEAVAVQPSDTAMPMETTAPTEVIPSDTDVPTDPPPTTVPTNPPTDLPPTHTPNVLLIYDDVSFTVHNQSGQSLAFEAVSFQSSSGRWDAEQWGIGLVESFPADNCLRMRDATSGNRQPPAVCGDLRALQLTAGSTLFWLDTDTFDVSIAGEVIATCPTTANTCEIYVPSS